jgi:predicted urease superfamily metal-dependent hydrolase
MGRPLGRKTDRSVMASRRKAMQIISEGKSPLDRLIADMEWWAREVSKLEKTLRETLPALVEGKSILEITRTEPVRNFFEARERLHEAALDAAQYVHPTFRAVAVTTPGQPLLPAQQEIIDAESKVLGDETEREQQAYLSVIKGGRGGPS